MRRKANILILCGLFLICAQWSQAVEQSTDIARVDDVRYAVLEGSSRLTIKVEGRMQYSVDRVENWVRILFGKTTVKERYARARMSFTSGFVARVNIDQRGQDSAVVAVLLREKTSFKVSRSDKEKALLVEVYPDSSFQNHAGNSLALPLQRLPFGGMLVGESSQHKVNEAPKVQQVDLNARKSPYSWPNTVALSVLLTIALALLGTSVLLVLIRSRSFGNATRRQSKAASVSTDPALIRTNSSQRNALLVDEQSDADSVVSSDRDSLARLLAKQYQRGEGELTPSFNFKGRNGEHKWNQKIRELTESNLERKGHASIARKLGIGKGEVELARLVRQAKNPKILSEESV
jgi:hypothetical protein